MRYCAIAYTFYDHDNRVRRYCEALVEEGHEVDVIALKSSASNGPDHMNGVRVHRIQQRTFESQNLLKYFWNYLRFFIKGTLVLNWLNAKRRFTLLHFHNIPDFLVFMGIIPKILGSKIILDIHDIVPEFYAQKFTSRMDKIPIRILLLAERLSVGFSDHIITANDIWRARIIERDDVSPEICTSILNYPSLKIYQGNKSEKAVEKRITKKGVFRLVYPGTISKHHGIDILIKAVMIIKNTIPGITLDIYCLEKRSYIIKELKEKIKCFGLEDNVFFNDALPPEKLAKTLALYDLGVVPKRGGIFAGEAFSSKIFDFMASGLPVVSSRTPVDEYYFNDEIISFFEVEDSDGLARRVVELYRNIGRREKMANLGRDYVAGNNWEIKKEEYLNIVRNLCNEHK